MISSTTSRIQYTLASGSQTLAVPFFFLEEEHLKVVRTRAGVATTLVLATNYTTTGEGGESGGSVVLNGTATAADDVITILRSVPLTQLVDYISNGRFPAETQERVLDKLTMIVQMLQEQATRGLRFGEGETLDGTLPLADRLGRFLKFNETTGGVEFITLDDIIVEVDEGVVAEARAARDAAQDYRDQAETQKNLAQTARTGAETARTGAETARTGAETAKAGADAVLAAINPTQFAQNTLTNVAAGTVDARLLQGGGVTLAKLAPEVLTLLQNSGLDPAKYQGTWNAATNTPTIPAAGAGNNGNWYFVATAGTATGNAAGTYVYGDIIVSNASAWLRRPVPPTVIAALSITNDLLADSSVSFEKLDGAIRDPLANSNPPTFVVSKIDPGYSPTANNTIVATIIQQFFPALVDGFIQTARVNMNGASVGRTVEFYLVRPVGGGNYTCILTSGLLAAESAGVFTFTPAAFSWPIRAGDVLAVYVSNSTGHPVYQSGGPAVGGSLRINARLNRGQTYTSSDYTAETNTRVYTMAADIIPMPIMSYKWADFEGGFLRLGQGGKILDKHRPATEVDLAGLLPGSSGVTTVEFDSSLSATKNVTRPAVTDATWRPFPTVMTWFGSTYAQNRVFIPWDNAALGFASAGVLKRVRIWPGATAASGSKFQVWVVRPNNPAAPTSFTWVATLGEVSAEPNTRYREISGLNVQVRAGDMLAYRGINVGLPYWDGGIQANGGRWMEFNLGDTSINALDAYKPETGSSLSASISSGRIFAVEAQIVSGQHMLSDDTPLAPVRFDASRRIPLVATRAPDAPWQGKKIVAVGTSITAGGNATGLNGYIRQAGLWHNADMDNQAVGSSGICWNGTRSLSLSATQAELTAAFGAGFAPQSFEVKLIGKAADLVIFDHGYNDRTYTIGTINSTDRSTFYGAYNYVIAALLADRPKQRFCFFTPVSFYNPDGVYNSQTAAIRTALFALAEKYCAPILDLTTTVQISDAQRTQFFADGVHPNDDGHAIIARSVYRFLLGL